MLKAQQGLPDFPKELNKGVYVQAQYIRKWFDELQRFEELKAKGYKYAYLFVMGNPIELLRPFGIFIGVYPEITSLNIAYKGEAVPVLNVADGLGVPTDACSYVRAGYASAYMTNKLKTKVPVIGALPEPDLLVLHYVGCQIYIHWWELYQYDYPKSRVIVYDVPHMAYSISPTKEQVEYVANQLKESVPKVEDVAGLPFDENKFKETMKYSEEAWDYWAKVIESDKQIPAPFDGYFESIYFMSMATLARGTKEAADYYKMLYDEMQERSKFIRDHPEYAERYRLVIEGVPPYPYFKNFWNMLKQKGARAVAATYPKVVATEFFKFDASRPYESLAEFMFYAYCNYTYEQRAEILRKYVEDYHADGVVIHSIKSCKSFSSNHADFKEYLSKELDVPVLLVESDHVDPRYFAEAQIKNRVDAFFEELAVKAKR